MLRLVQIFLLLGVVCAAAPAQQLAPDWRPIGNRVLEAGLAGPAAGPVARVWFSDDGLRLHAQTASGKLLETIDFEHWTRSSSLPPVERGMLAARDWEKLTEYRGVSIIGGPALDAAISPLDSDDIVLATRFGLWRTLDGGASWNSLNSGLSNLGVQRILSLPNGTQGTRILLEGNEFEAVWAPGEKDGWRVVPPQEAAREALLAASLGPVLGARPSRVVVAGSWVYAGGGAGRLWVSADRGFSWRSFRLGEADGRVEAIFVAAGQPAIAVAAISSESGPRVARTMNGGIFWDDISANLPPGAVYGVTADLATGAIYAASDSGLFWTVTDLRSGGAATDWLRLAVGAGDPKVRDVQLDADGNQLFIALDGEGVVTAVAPHRFLSPRVVNAASGLTMPAAPGALLSVLGSHVSSARVGELEVPVLAASEMESQIQIPFAVTGSQVRLDLVTAQARLSNLELPLRPSSPAIFTDRDGTPIVLDAERALLLDASMPARAGATIQILATGLGRVSPEWPAGLAAPVDAPPKVIAPVRVLLDRVSLEVIGATLAPGYAGFYLIEAKIPEVVNLGPAELYLEAGGVASNRVSLHVAP